MAARAGGRGLGLGDRAAAGRGGRTGAAAPGQQTSEGGGGGFAQGLGFFRTVGGEDMSGKLAFIAAHMAEHAVRLMCRVLGASRSWFHAWQRAAPTRAERAIRREVLVAEVPSRPAGNGTAPPGFTPIFRPGDDGYQSGRSPS